MDWLHENRPAGTPYLMLDDRHWWFRPDNPHLMIVDCDDGFLPANEGELRARLKGVCQQTYQLPALISTHKNGSYP